MPAWANRGLESWRRDQFASPPASQRNMAAGRVASFKPFGGGKGCVKWQKVPSSGSTRPRGTASSRVRMGTICSFTSARSRTRASDPRRRPEGLVRRHSGPERQDAGEQRPQGVTPFHICKFAERRPIGAAFCVRSRVAARRGRCAAGSRRMKLRAHADRLPDDRRSHVRRALEPAAAHRRHHGDAGRRSSSWRRPPAPPPSRLEAVVRAKLPWVRRKLAEFEALGHPRRPPALRGRRAPPLSGPPVPARAGGPAAAPVALRARRASRSTGARRRGPHRHRGLVHGAGAGHHRGPRRPLRAPGRRRAGRPSSCATSASDAGASATGARAR